MAREEGDGGHGVGEVPVEKSVQHPGQEPFCSKRVLEVEAVGEELGEAGSCDDDAGGVTTEFDQVQRVEDGGAGGGGEAVVWGGGDG